MREISPSFLYANEKYVFQELWKKHHEQVKANAIIRAAHDKEATAHKVKYI